MVHSQQMSWNGETSDVIATCSEIVSSYLPIPSQMQSIITLHMCLSPCFVDVTKAVVVNYNQGEKLESCSGSPSSSTISLLCATGLGQPVLKSRPSSSQCTFHFEWQTSLACYEQRDVLTEDHWKVRDPRTEGYFDLNLLDLEKLVHVIAGHRMFS